MRNSRKRKALVTYLNRTIVDLGNDSYLIQGRKLRKGGRAPSFVVAPDVETGEIACPCEGFKENLACKHMGALKKYLTDGAPKVGYDHLDDSRRATYPQDNPRYRMARRVMLRALPFVVRALARHVFPISGSVSRKPGRPRVYLADLIYCVTLRTILKRGGDHTQALVDDAFEKRLLHRRPVLFAAPVATVTITANMRKNPHVHEAMQALIAATASVEKGKATRIGIDGSEFDCPTLTQGGNKKNRLIDVKTVKLHAAVDVDTGLIVAATVTGGKDGEAEQALLLLEEARTIRFVSHLVADAGYVAEYLFRYCLDNKIECAIPTKSNISTEGDGILAQHARAWRVRSEEDKTLYAMRQISESAFSRIKSFTSEDLRGLTFGAQKTELLSHVLVCNVAWLIARYVYGEIDLPWLDSRCRKILEPAREIVKDLPIPDLSPKYRDGYQDPEAA